MGLFTRDCYDEDNDARIALIGQAAFDKEIADRIANTPPTRWSRTEPKVTKGDVIMNYLNDNPHIEMFVTRIDNNGEIWGKTLSDSIDEHQGAEWKWEGPYKRVGSTREYDTTKTTEDGKS